jgi:ectoine hydroxylase-related dioxygenase (phytanoyl-CoA dioxygenase family)
MHTPSGLERQHFKEYYVNTELTDEQIESYRRDGFVAQRNFLNPEEVEELKSGVLDAISGMGKSKVSEGDSAMQDGDSYYDRVFTQKLNLWRINDQVKQTMLNPELGKMMGKLEGVDGFRVWHDQALIKEPFGNPTGWHVDNTYWSFDSRHAISIWIALEPATLENGCMWFIPGSHKIANYERAIAGIGADMAELFKIYPEMAEIDTVGVPMQPGDCSFHNGMTGHGAGANMTRARRIAMTCAYMPIGCAYNGQPNILPSDYHESLKPGDVLENDDWNPVVYQNG